VTFLPIVERELRVASRKRSTYWLRVVAAVVALLFGGAFLILSFMPIGRSQLGAWLFGILTKLSLATALSAGLFFTADSLSEEKREGTLGFLFLTDLRGYDVVLGKLLATSLRGVFALLAIFPILAVTFVMGGVEGATFWKTVLSLANALFFSLAAGLFVSAFSKDSQRALGNTLFVMLAFLAGAPLLDLVFGLAKGGGYKPWLTYTSPGYAFVMTNNWGAFFWKALLTSHLAGWAMLLTACIAVPRTWQTKTTKASVKVARFTYGWRYGSARRRSVLRERLLSKNPILWLMCRERWQAAIVWIFSTIVTAAFVWILVEGWGVEITMIWKFVGMAFALFLYLGAASQASRFLMDARRSGLIETLLATPLTGREIIQGQLRGLARTFGWPIGLYLCVHLAVSIISQYQIARMISPTHEDGGIQTLFLAGIGVCAEVSILVGNLVALVWFGIWMGMTSKNASFATLKTLLFAQFIPWCVIGFFQLLFVGLVMQGMIGISGRSSTVMSSATLLPVAQVAITATLTLLKNFGFYLASRARLYRGFRDMAIASVAPIRATFVPPPLPVKPVT
jgi:hypothetical protein